MAKKILCIVLSVILAVSCFAIGGFAVDVSTPTYPKEELAITEAKDRIDRVFLTGSTAGSIPDEAASKEILEYNLGFWNDDIIEEYHTLEADSNTTNEDWEALYRKMRTPYENDWSTGDMYAYRDESKAEFNVRLVASKTEDLKPGEEFDVDVYIKSNFYTTALYATFFYNNDVVDIISCTEKYIGTDKENKQLPKADKKQHPMAEGFEAYAAYDELPHLGDYTYSGYGGKNAGVDFREQEWPASVKAIDGWKDKYEAYGFIFMPDVEEEFVNPIGSIGTEKKFMTLKFKVKEDAKAGSTATIFAPSDSVWTLEGASYRSQNQYSAYWWFFRVDPGSNALDMKMPDYNAESDQTLTCTPATIKVEGEAAPDYADYTALDAAVAAYDSTLSNLYTKASWATYAAAVTAGSSLSRTLLASEQSTVDAATKAITDAKAALVLNDIVSAEVIGSPVIGSEANVKVVVNGSPSAIRLTTDGNTLTFNRENATIATDGDNEIWNVKVAVSSESTTYTVYAKYGSDYGENGKTVTINATEGADLSVHSISVPDMYGSYTDGKIYQGVHNVVVRTSTDVFKVQFIDKDGNTRTYNNRDYAPVVEGDELVWTLPLSFTYLGNITYYLRTRTADTTFAYTGDSISARVVY